MKIHLSRGIAPEGPIGTLRRLEDSTLVVEMRNLTYAVELSPEDLDRIFAFVLAETGVTISRSAIRGK